MIEAFLFDLDGVIVDTAHYHHLSWRKLCQTEFGTDLTVEENENLKGISRMDSLHWILTHQEIPATEQQMTKWTDLKNNWYLELIRGMTPQEILPGVLEFILQAREEGFKTGLASSSKNARLVLDLLQMEDLFDTVLDGKSVLFAKPHPEIYIRASAHLGLLGDACVVFEDAEKGIQSALSAGCNTIGVGNSELLPNAPVVIPSFEDLMPMNAISLISSEKAGQLLK